MSNRTVAVVLRAQVDDYMRQMRAAQRQTDEVDRAARSATEQLRLHNEALTKVGTGMVAVGATAAVALGVAAKAAIDYGSKMAQLQSLSHATQGDMQRLSDAAMKQGTAFGFSATQVADAEIELTKAGRDATQILGGDLKGALALAAAGQMDVAQATSIGVTALTQFAKSGATIPQVADSLAAGADKALGSVQDLGMALQQGGLVASQMGLDLNDTVGTLSAFAQAGLIGSDAGTSLKTMLLSLQSPSKQAKELLDQYNIAAYDQRGNFVGITKLAGELQTAFKDKSQAERDAALSTIFGSDAIRSANVLYTQGAKGIQGWVDAVDDTGFASAQAAGKMNSLQGDLQKLSAAFQTDLIKAGGSADGPLREATQTATALVSALGDVPQPIIAITTAGTALVAGVGLLGGVALIAVPKIAAFRGALDELKISGSKAASVFGKGAGVVAGITFFASALAATSVHGTADAQQIALAGERVKDGWKGLDKVFGGGGFFTGLTDLKHTVDQLSTPLGAGNAAKALDSITFGLTHFSDVYKTSEGNFDAIGQQLAGLAQQDYGRASASFSDLVGKYKLGADDTKRLLTLMPAYRDELIKQAEAAHVSASDQNLLLIAQGKGAVSAKVLAASQAAAAKSAEANADKVAELAGSATSAKGSIDDLSNAIKGFGSVTLDARSAQRDFEKSVDDAREAAKKAGDATKDTTQADRDKQAALDGVASAAIATAAAFAKQPGGVKKAQAALEDGRKAFIDIATQMGISRAAAKKLADQLGLIPSNISAAVNVSGVETAITNLKDLRQQVRDTNGIRAQVLVDVTARGTDALNAQNYTRRADGGAITGPGPKGVDSVMAILAPGEHVLTAAEVDRMGGQGAVSAFRADLMAGVRAYAKGGPVDAGGVTAYLRSMPKPKKAAPNAIQQAKDAAAKAEKNAATLQKRVIAQKKRAAAAQKAADRAQHAYEDIDGSKKNRAVKKAAKERADRAKKAAAASEDRVKTLRDQRDKARETQQAATDTAAQLRLDREDFVSAERRDPNRAATDPLTYIDQLRAMSRDDNYSDAKRQKYDDTANKYERSLARLTEQSEAAASKLADLKSSADTMRSGITSAIAGGYTLAGAPLVGATQASTKTINTASGWITRDGIRMQNYSTTTQDVAAQAGAVTLGSIQGYYRSGARDTATFAADLKTLAGRGLSGALLAELAGYGIEQGAPIAKALLTATRAQIASVNADYATIGRNAATAAGTVTDVNYKALIDDAQRNADKIAEQIKTDGEKLRHLIASAFGLKGYATGTDSATAGIHWVGEDGPELVGFRGGEAVLNARESARWVAGGSGGQQAASAAPTRIVVEFPQEIGLRDADGTFRGMVRTEARGVASTVVTERHDEIAVRLMGASV